MLFSVSILIYKNQISKLQGTKNDFCEHKNCMMDVETLFFLAKHLNSKGGHQLLFNDTRV